MLWWTLRQLKSADPVARAGAARKAGASGQKAAVAGLIAALDDADITVRAAAAEALGNMGDDRAVEALGRLLAAPARKEQSRKPAGSDDKQSAIHALSRLGKAALEPLFKALQSDDRELRKCAAVVLGSMGCNEAVGPLVDRLDDSRSQVRQAAAQALEKLGGRDSIRGLAHGLGHKDPETRRVAAEILGRIGGRDAVEPLSHAVADSDETVQLAAVAALGIIGGIDAAVALRPALEGVRKSVRSAAEAALRTMPLATATPDERAVIAVLTGDMSAAVREGDAAVQPLVEALHSSSSVTRMSAAEALGRLKAGQAGPALVRLLKDHDDGVCRTAALALSQIGAEAVPILLETLASPSGSVHRPAADALGNIGDIRAVIPLTEVIRRNIAASSYDPGPFEAALSARDALVKILNISAGLIPTDVLESVAKVPDAISRCPGSDDEQTPQREVAVDCAGLRALASAELAHRMTNYE